MQLREPESFAQGHTAWQNQSKTTALLPLDFKAPALSSTPEREAKFVYNPLPPKNFSTFVLQAGTQFRSAFRSCLLCGQWFGGGACGSRETS